MKFCKDILGQICIYLDYRDIISLSSCCSQYLNDILLDENEEIFYRVYRTYSDKNYNNKISYKLRLEHKYYKGMKSYILNKRIEIMQLVDVYEKDKGYHLLYNIYRKRFNIYKRVNKELYDPIDKCEMDDKQILDNKINRIKEELRDRYGVGMDKKDIDKIKTKIKKIRIDIFHNI